MRALALVVPLLGPLGCWAPTETLEVEALEDVDLQPAPLGAVPLLADAHAVDRDVLGIAARGHTLAVWTRRTVAVSLDGGQRFAPAARTDADIQAVTLDDDGTVIVVDASGAVTRGTERHPLHEGATTEALIARGGRIVWLGSTGEDEESTLLLSDDHGETWQPLPLPEDCTESRDLGLSADGTLEFFGGCEAGCGGGYQFRYALKLPGRTWEEIDWDIDSPVDRYVGQSGWAYGLGSCGDDEDGDAESLCALSARRVRHVARLSSLDAEPYPRLRAGASNARTDALVVGDSLVTVHDGAMQSATVMEVPPDTDIGIAIDDDDHIYGVIGGATVRWDDGWRPMPVQLPG